VHLRQPPFLVRRLHAALVSLGEELQMRHGCPLIVRQGLRRSCCQSLLTSAARRCATWWRTTCVSGRAR
jgi:hypothetical protein